MAKYRKVTVVSDACCRIPNAHIKGRAGRGRAACGYVIFDEQGNAIEKRGVFLGEMTVPEAEYRGLINALDAASGLCRDEADVFLDSEFVVRQVTGIYGAKAPHLKPLLDQVKALERRFTTVRFFHHPRTARWAQEADKLANDALDAVLAP